MGVVTDNTVSGNTVYSTLYNTTHMHVTGKSVSSRILARTMHASDKSLGKHFQRNPSILQASLQGKLFTSFLGYPFYGVA